MRILSRCSDRNAKASNGWSPHSHRGAGRDGAGAVGETLAAFRRVHVAGLFEAEISERPDYRLCIDWDGVI
jgi:hypothetical protein